MTGRSGWFVFGQPVSYQIEECFMNFGKLISLFGAALVAGVVGVTAISWADETDPIKSRREHMKGNGAAAKLLGGYLDGSVPFDAAKAAEATAAISKVGHEFADEFDEYFPDNSKTGDTKAAPAIWENKAEFKKLAEALEVDAAAASKAAAGGADAFKAAAGKMFGNCKGCHEKYKLQ
jgi:cytochrome c556